MKFSRQDYTQRIIDKAGKIPEDEPVFLLRRKMSMLRTLCAIMLNYWRKLVIRQWLKNYGTTQK